MAQERQKKPGAPEKFACLKQKGRVKKRAAGRALATDQHKRGGGVRPTRREGDAHNGKRPGTHGSRVFGAVGVLGLLGAPAARQENLWPRGRGSGGSFAGVIADYHRRHHHLLGAAAGDRNDVRLGVDNLFHDADKALAGGVGGDDASRGHVVGPQPQARGLGGLLGLTQAAPKKKGGRRRWCEQYWRSVQRARRPGCSPAFPLLPRRTFRGPG